MLRQVKNTLVAMNQQQKTIIFEKNHDTENTVLLLGSGRSGTTWVSDIININHDYRNMFEPFNPFKVKEIAGFLSRQYIRPDDTDKQTYETVRKVLSGAIRARWIDQFNDKRVVEKRLIKDIRANLFAKYMKVNFPEIPILYLIRHPYAVVNSRIKMGWGTELDVMVQQDTLMADFFEPFRDVILEVQQNGSTFEKQVLMWCMENYVPLKQFEPGEFLPVFYENVCLEHEEEAAKIFSFLGIVPGSNLEATINKPSNLVRKGSAILSGGNLLTSWKKDVTDEDTEKGDRLLKLFGLDVLYDENYVGDYKALQAYMEK